MNVIVHDTKREKERKRKRPRPSKAMIKLILSQSDECYMN